MLSGTKPVLFVSSNSKVVTNFKVHLVLGFVLHEGYDIVILLTSIVVDVVQAVVVTGGIDVEGLHPLKCYSAYLMVGKSICVCVCSRKIISGEILLDL